MSQSTKRRLSAICNCCDQPFAATGVSRRQLLAAGVVAFAAMSLQVRVFAQAKPHRIDVHHHVAPPSWLNAMDIIGRTNPPLANWSVQKTLDDMDKGAVATAMLSPTAPPGCASRQGCWRQDCSRGQRVQQEAYGRSSRPLRHFRHAAAGARRRVAPGNRLRFRHAQGRRYRHADELRRQMAWAPVPEPDLGGAQSPQGDRLYSPRRRQLLRQPGPRLAGLGNRMGNRLDP